MQPDFMPPLNIFLKFPGSLRFCKKFSQLFRHNPKWELYVVWPAAVRPILGIQILDVLGLNEGERIHGCGIYLGEFVVNLAYVQDSSALIDTPPYLFDLPSLNSCIFIYILLEG